MPVRHRLLLFCAIFSVAACVVLLSQPGPAAPTSNIDPRAAPSQSAYVPGSDNFQPNFPPIQNRRLIAQVGFKPTSFGSQRIHSPGKLSQPEKCCVSGVTTLTTDTITIPTYPYAAYLYTATNTTYNIPYRWLHWAQYDGSHPQPVDQTYTRLTLENEWLRVSVLPELGGRVYEMINKVTGNNELYRNPVIKPTHWGPSEQGWWLAAGGLEWGLPVEEHGYESAIPWLYETITGTAGITITLRDSTQPDRLRAAISVFLPNDRAVLSVRPRLENGRNVALAFKWWDNAMLAPGPGNSIGKQGSNPDNIDLKFIFPESQVTVHSTGDPTLPPEGQAMSWPIYKNLDRSRLQNWDQWLGFFARPAASADWVSVIDQAHQEGLVRVFPRSVAQGSKGFAMGWRHPIGAGAWTDDDSYYAELHGGLAPTFGDTVSIGAQQAIEWEETWYPVAGMNNLTTANADAALDVEQTGAQLNVTAYATRPYEHARLAIYQKQHDMGVLIASWNLALVGPNAPIVRSLATTAQLQDLRIIFTADDALLAAYNLTNDGRAPSTWMGVLPTYVTQTAFPVTWGAIDFDGVYSYDVQVKDGYEGLWTSWLTATTQTADNFTSEDGHTYFFRVRARDLGGNQSQYNSDPVGDAFTSVLLTPAPILETSFIWTWPFFKPNVPLTYTIFINSTGSLSTTLTLTDTVPPSMTLVPETLSLNSWPAPTFDGATIHWTGIITGGSTYLRLVYVVTPNLSFAPGAVVTNTMNLSFEAITLTRTVTTIAGFDAYLPLVLRQTP
jgi:uncharacterized repeat protein (TIGR01451 family)